MADWSLGRRPVSGRGFGRVLRTAVVAAGAALLASVCSAADPAKVTGEAVDLHLANVRRTRYDGRHISLTDQLMAQSLKQMTCDVQIIWGAADALCIPDNQARIAECRAARPDVRIDNVAGAGHWVMYEAADEVNALMLDFMK